MPQTHVLRLTPGEDLRLALAKAFADLQAGQNTTAACIISAVGSLSRAVLRYADQPEGTLLAEPLELVTLSGTLSADGVHLHASVATACGEMRGGHVMPGCVVRTTAEIVLAPLPGWVFTREQDAQTGFKELVAKPVGRA
ncbi:putative DNA-binding protein with PD1-like DNA-binding motif [Polaromonas sp. CF318]|uniref:PPC domain-containing DNA-binding protein n=1 Tax=Polaromonas sp. CF318 TaxID=1144318 RepID=UPI0002710838|nr:PPC domain-containing DNA-binding protein [Polaromonas sp. CF318]EJL90973.1 putative DNA-binding protein with PD1-like DNA-binding motif [Polaromonas sp. CF318]